MRTNNIQQEILLAPGFFQRISYCTDMADNYTLHIQQLKKMCWSNLLDNMLPNLLENSLSYTRICLQHILHQDSLLEIELSDSPSLQERPSSVDPCLFLNELFYN